MTILLFVAVTAILYYLLFRFAVSRLERRPAAPAVETRHEPRVNARETVDEPGWTDLDDLQLDRLLRESSP